MVLNTMEKHGMIHFDYNLLKKYTVYNTIFIQMNRFPLNTHKSFQDNDFIHFERNKHPSLKANKYGMRSTSSIPFIPSIISIQSFTI